MGKHRRNSPRGLLGNALKPALAVLLSAGLVAGGTAAASTASARVKDPVSPRPPATTVEGLTPYLPQVSCDPTTKPGTAALRSMLLSTYGGRDLGVTRSCDIGGLSEHKEGRAFDWGLSASNPAERAVAKQFLHWLLAAGPTGSPAYNARRLGVMYVIWNGRIWGAYRASEGWRPYTGGESHADHIHISLAWNGAMKRTSWWTGKRASVDYGPCPRIEGEMAARYTRARTTPCPAPIPIMSLTGTPLLQRDSEGPYVKQLQRILSVRPVSGWFGPLTDAALRSFQAEHHLKVTGRTSPKTWATLRGDDGGTASPGTSASVSPKYLSRLKHRVKKGQTLSWVAAYWRSSVSAIKAASHLRSSTVRTGQLLVVPVKSWLTRYSHMRLHKGSEGKAVKALQKALRMPKRYHTGYFGDITKGYVNRLRRHYGGHPTGIAGPGVWHRLGA